MCYLYSTSPQTSIPLYVDIHFPPWIRADLFSGNLAVSQMTSEALHLQCFGIKKKQSLSLLPPSSLVTSIRLQKKKENQVNQWQKPYHFDPAAHFIYFSYHSRQTPSNSSFLPWEAERQRFRPDVPLIGVHVAGTQTSYSSSCRVRPMTVTLASWALNFPELWVTGKQKRKVLIERHTL